MQALNLTGQIYGNLTVVTKVTNTKYSKWLCKCICGNQLEILQQELRNGCKVSCGCIKNNTRPLYKGVSQTPLYAVWTSMKQRILNPKSKAYYLYGAKGLGIDPSWKIFSNFKNWAESSGYEPILSIDRIDPNIGYYPNNCRWTTKIIQARNIKKYKGKSKYLGVHWDTKRAYWIASISINNKKKWLGQFSEEKTAAEYRDNYIKNNNLKGFTLNFK